MSTPKSCGSETDGQLERIRAYWHQAELRDRWRAADVPPRHAARVRELRGNVHGPWQNTYGGLRAQLGTGFLVALLGRRGTGKTQLAACLIADVVERGGTARYVKAGDLFRRLRECFRADAVETETEVVQRFCGYGLLVIDEAHERGHTDFEDRVLTQIVDRRYDHERDTLLLSNETKAGFADSAGSSIVSRMHECGGAVECNWPSFREPAQDASGTPRAPG